MTYKEFLELKTPWGHLYNIVPISDGCYGLRGCDFAGAKEFCISFGIDNVKIFIY